MEDLLMYYEGYEADYLDAMADEEERYYALENWYNNGYVGDDEEENWG